MFVAVSQKKWDRLKGILESIVGQFRKSNDRPKLELRYLKQKVGFLVHLSIAYPLIAPFLKEFYLRMHSCREGREKNGWKMST